MKRTSFLGRVGAALLCLSLLLATSCNEPAASNTTDPITTTKTTQTTATSATTDTSATTSTTATTATSATTSNTTQQEPEVVEPEVTMLPSQEVSIVSMNLWDTDDLGERAAAMLSVLNSYNADSIGVQECTANWADVLDVGLERYARVGIDAYGSDKGSFSNYVYYLKDKYVAVDSGTFWMSNTPDVPSTYGSTTTSFRNCTWVVLENVETGFRYVHMNCHLDWDDLNANVVQVLMIRNQLLRFEEMGYPVFSTGDFNVSQDSVAYRQMVASERIADSKKVATDTMDAPTHNNGDIIDFCFITAKSVDVQVYRVIQDAPDGVRPSDHFGIYTRSTVKSMPEQKGADYTPQFGENVQIEITPTDIRNARLTLSFDQAKSANGYLAVKYRVTVTDANGDLVLQSMAGAGSYCEFPPERASAHITGGMPSEQYTVTVQPISIFGEEGAPIRASFTWPGEAYDPNRIPTADILDLSVQGSTIIDVSDNDYTISSLGTVVAQDDKLTFQKDGCVKVVGISEHYPAMQEGFSIEAILTTGEDVRSFQCPLSSQHSGGFGFVISGSSLHFKVHDKDAYIGIAAGIQPNTTYHIVGVFDGSYISLYVNGKLIQSALVTGEMKLPTSAGAAYLGIGADSNSAGTGEHFSDVSISRVRVYSSVLLDTQISRLAKQTNN